MSMSNLSRRSFVGLSGSAAAILGLGLVGCGGGSNSSDGAKAVSAEPQNGTPANTPLDKLPLPEKGKVYNNPQKRDNVKDGGTLVLPSGEIPIVKCNVAVHVRSIYFLGTFPLVVL